MQTFYLQILEYNHHYNQQLAKYFVNKANLTFARSLQLFNHLINAQQIWNNRIKPDGSSFGIWEMHKIGILANLDSTNYEKSVYEKSVQIVKQLPLETTIAYANSKGENFTNSIQDILYHIVNHATYHRGQIAVEWKNAGIEPLITDYIFYKR